MNRKHIVQVEIDFCLDDIVYIKNTNLLKKGRILAINTYIHERSGIGKIRQHTTYEVWHDEDADDTTSFSGHFLSLIAPLDYDGEIGGLSCDCRIKCKCPIPEAFNDD